MKSTVWRTGLLLAMAVSAIAFVSYHSATAEEPATPRIDVILWFDTEDYLLPADDDAALRLATMLSERKIRATFKIVGEKARVLKRRGRTDVIDALKNHDIAYHSNYHSVHPTPTEYLADCGLLDGISEFVRREGSGAADVRRIFGVETLSCYGQPGASWAPQAIAALKQIGVAPHGIPCYVDEGSHVGLDGKPFWYAGALNVFKMKPNVTRMQLHDPAALEPAKKEVAEIAERLRKQGGGLISIFYHPCEWVHREFWDSVNFKRGANPPRELWQAPGQRSAEETESAFQRFGQYIDSIKAIPGVHFVTAGELPELYPDAVHADMDWAKDLPELAARLIAKDSPGIDFQVIGKRAYSAADQFELLTATVSELITRKPPKTSAAGLLGPDAAAPEDSPRKADWPAFRDAVLDVQSYLETQQRIPSRVFLGADAVSPQAFLSALATVYDQHHKSGKFPDELTLGASPELLPARHVAQDTPGLFGGWVIHKENFRAPKLMDLARLQAWTLKPALRKE